MPRLNDSTLEDIKVKGTNFQYSGTRLEDLGATEYTLVTLVVDQSGSVSDFEDDLNKCIAEVVKSCRKSPRADNLLLRIVTFNQDEEEFHGYKLLINCNPDDYLDLVTPGGMTALYDATYNALNSLNDYSKNLTDNDFDVNSIIFVMTDGCDNESTYTPNKIKEMLKKMVQSESLESIITVLIGVNIDEPEVSSALSSFKDEVEFTQYVEIDNANEKTLAKLAEFVSKSISSQSQSLGSGSAANQSSLTI
jgi:uncharacterized protein YegL